MLAVLIVVAILSGVQFSTANDGCPDDPSECVRYCTEDRGCLIGVCDIVTFYMNCVCKGCSHNEKSRYRNYGCNTLRSTRAPAKTKGEFYNRIRERLHGVGLTANIWRNN